MKSVKSVPLVPSTRISRSVGSSSFSALRLLLLEFLESLFAGEHLRPLTASVAFDEAAPLELTVALPHFGVLVRVVAPPTAHEVTAVRVRRGAVAQASLGAHAPRGCVLLAVVGRPLNVN